MSCKTFMEAWSLSCMNSQGTREGCRVPAGASISLSLVTVTTCTQPSHRCSVQGSWATIIQSQSGSHSDPLRGREAPWAETLYAWRFRVSPASPSGLQQRATVVSHAYVPAATSGAPSAANRSTPHFPHAGGAIPNCKKHRNQATFDGTAHNVQHFTNTS
jgi:hypothetical protein